MKRSIETHAARLTAWQARQQPGRRARSRAYFAKRTRDAIRVRNGVYRELVVQGKVDGRGSRAATKAPHSKDLRRRRHAIAKASRRANR